MAELVFYRRGEEVLRIGIDAPKLTIGRGESCDVVIPDMDVSRQQAVIFSEGTEHVIEDLSKKGTVVLGKRVDRAILHDGSDLRLGQWQAVYRLGTGTGVADTTWNTGLDHTTLQPADAPREVPAQVRVRIGAKESVHRLNTDALTVGADADNDLVLADTYVSAHHAKITRRAGCFHVLDQKSTNGTWVGTTRVHEALVPFYSTLKVGSCEITFEPMGSGAAKRDASYLGIIGADPSVRQLTQLIERVAPSAAAVAIFGESGTGKELVAHAIHTRSARSGEAFVPVNCAAISRELIESELFGHEKGAFTGALAARKGAFEEADHGTLFLDEIGELPLELQSKLLRALESGEIKRVGSPRPHTVDVRVVAATNRDLLSDIKKGRFREDLYYRLCVVPLTLPPLRARRGDIALLVSHFLERFTPKGQHVTIAPAAIQRLELHSWPGNIRELRNVIHRALLLRQSAQIEAADISFDHAASSESAVDVPELPAGTTMEQMLEAVERQIIESALRKYEGNRERVAKELGLARSTLFKRLKTWGLTHTDEAGDAIG